MIFGLKKETENFLFIEVIFLFFWTQTPRHLNNTVFFYREVKKNV